MQEQVTGAFRVRTVAIIGAGTAGRAFAFRCAQAGFVVVLEDVMPSKLRRAQDEYSELGLLPEGAVRYASTVEDAVADADVVVDFVPDELESKLEIFSLLDRMAPPRTVLCTPTKALSIRDLASCTYRSDRCVAVQWLDPCSAEVIVTETTHPFAQALIADFLSALAYSVRIATDRSEAMLVKNIGVS